MPVPPANERAVIRHQEQSAREEILQKCECHSLRLVLRRMWQRPFVFEYFAEITAVDPAAAGRTADEVFGLILRRSAEEIP
jgi:hypothetical protein